ncbi:hypothetical protein HPP92_007781 [Vanilla planifolia]|uniref:X8 domain-containing protein n=1 Tax=Vanilla planifolia TaxID=51239 RepID=A0A835RI62_VANPL|nr:hypothetical protein HPP92_007781 [Vanilla planifolia]
MGLLPLAIKIDFCINMVSSAKITAVQGLIRFILKSRLYAIGELLELKHNLIGLYHIEDIVNHDDFCWKVAGKFYSLCLFLLIYVRHIICFASQRQFAGIDWACGPGLANCGAIQPGQPCYVANNLVAIASYAYNSYYQANQARGGTCFFNNTAMLTNIDPSNGSCIFPGSSGTGTNPGSGSNSSGSAGSPGGSTFAPPLSPFQPTFNDNGVSKLQAVKLVYLSPLVLLSLLNC